MMASNDVTGRAELPRIAAEMRRHCMKMQRMKSGNGKWHSIQDRKTVLITGATSGIGLALAKEFAREGCRLVLAASRENRLKMVAAKLEREFPTSVIGAICQDLSEDGGGIGLYGKVKARNISVDVLVNNAGFGLAGEEISLSLGREREMIGVNISAVTELTHLFLRDMCRRGGGKILNVASVGAFQPGPYTAAYYATKAYVANYSRALRVEAKKYGVQVCVLCPGTTRTAFFEKTGSEIPVWAMSARKVAKAAFRGLERNQEVIIPGAGNRLLQLLPQRVRQMGVAFLKR